MAEQRQCQISRNKHTHIKIYYKKHDMKEHILISRKSAETLTAVLALVSMKIAFCRSA